MVAVNQPSVICCLRFIAVCENGGGKSTKRYLLLKVYSSLQYTVIKGIWEYNFLTYNPLYKALDKRREFHIHEFLICR